jgi:DNA-binding transcriptional LysR family regulator
VAASTRDPSGRLRIAANQLLYEVLLEPVVLPFVQRHARIELALDVLPDPLQALRTGYDLALVVGPAPDSTMGSLVLGRAKMGCYASAAYRERHGVPRTPDELSAHTVAVFGHDLVLRAVAAGVALARLPHFYVRRSTLASRVSSVLDEWTCPPVPAYAVFPNRDRPSPTVRAFLAQLRDPLRSPARR